MAVLTVPMPGQQRPQSEVGTKLERWESPRRTARSQRAAHCSLASGARDNCYNPQSGEINGWLLPEPRTNLAIAALLDYPETGGLCSPFSSWAQLFCSSQSLDVPSRRVFRVFCPECGNSSQLQVTVPCLAMLALISPLHKSEPCFGILCRLHRPHAPPRQPQAGWQHSRFRPNGFSSGC